ncbi:SDR family NAD(P)-dependent oxidoreductase [Enterovirga rhinocerotis]|uniref:3-oxoacyl-[acyl-carrier protein] reductase n=1 Tax=Enterovirga rhinocerotis TaxID=1339210 RepID=A0A4R7BJE1_9HYPH|nr:SDR family NAD(P)-dependent oxidoreductase [Enterovirga rhinocerotis]TDR85378.1 3-oxoacyl-[acyl-carrier protein] reductase [Enterovirga rhinocerotis]
MPLPDDPVAIVTGAARGIGRACAEELARKGFRVALADLDSSDLDAAAEAVGEIGPGAIVLRGDVSDYEEVQALAASVVARWGRIDVLVNNAGISQPKSLLEISEAEFDRTIAVNLKGHFNWCKAVAPGMVAQQGGRIVNMSSISAGTGGAPSAVSKFAYVAAKAGVQGLTRGLAKELAPHVTVNAICPGSIETSLTRALINARREAIQDTIPLGRIGTPLDIAVVVAFLATVEPNFITGEIIDVDGGQWVN